jgi:hypothetical protein
MMGCWKQATVAGLVRRLPGLKAAPGSVSFNTLNFIDQLAGQHRVPRLPPKAVRWTVTTRARVTNC